MQKFKTYRALILISLFLYSLIIFTSLSFLNLSLRQILVVIIYLVFISVYFFLFDLLRYFKEPWWKKIAVVLLFLGDYVSFIFFLLKYMSLLEYYVTSFILTIPYFIAFLTLRNNEIKNLAQAQACLLVLLPLTRIITILVNFNLNDYQQAYDVIVLLPTFFCLLMCQKMVNISSKPPEQHEISTEQIDLL